MKIANVSTIKNELSKYLRYVRQGERVRILDRNEAIADIVPVSSGATGSSNLQRLEAAGVIRRGTAKVPHEIFSALPSKPSRGKPSGVLDALLDERKEGR